MDETVPNDTPPTDRTAPTKVSVVKCVPTPVTAVLAAIDDDVPDNVIAETAVAPVFAADAFPVRTSAVSLVIDDTVPKVTPPTDKTAPTKVSVVKCDPTPLTAVLDVEEVIVPVSVFVETTVAALFVCVAPEVNTNAVSEVIDETVPKDVPPTDRTAPTIVSVVKCEPTPVTFVLPATDEIVPVNVNGAGLVSVNVGTTNASAFITARFGIATTTSGGVLAVSTHPSAVATGVV